MADPVRKPHPDVEPAVTGANTSRHYHVSRVACMNGEYAEEYENRVKNPPRQRIPNPPVGEFCTALMRNSADVNASPQRLNDRPETSLLAPYLGMMIERNGGDTASHAYSLTNEFVRRAELPANQQSTNAVRFGNTNPAFLLSQGVALDAAFTKTVMDVRAGRTPQPPVPTTNREQLHARTDSCFRNIGVTLQQCVDAGRDQAALYLNRENTVLELPSSAPATPSRSNSLAAPRR